MTWMLIEASVALWSGFSVSLTVNHDRPCHPGNLVGECNCRDLYRSAIHYSCQPSSFGAVLSRIANDSHSPGDQ
jgi:acyl-coenzyme A thioesterase PaaI-like protein